MELVQRADLRYPVILGAEGQLMDGMHRVARSLLEGRTTVSAVRLWSSPNRTSESTCATGTNFRPATTTQRTRPDLRVLDSRHQSPGDPSPIAAQLAITS
jgi:hypothetical protein